MPTELSQEFVRRIFDYENGHLIWKMGRRVCGHIAGKLKGGYIKISINGDQYFAHRLIFLWHHGYIPERIDHIDCNGYNNKIENLRGVTASENARHWSRGKWHGTSWHNGKYQARIVINGVRYALGRFETREEAKAAYDAAALKYYGEFLVE